MRVTIQAIKSIPDGFDPNQSALAFVDAVNNGGGYNDACAAAGIAPETLDLIMQSATEKNAPTGFVHFFALISSLFSAQPATKTKAAYVYIVRDSIMGACKIGIANDYRNRLGSLQTACPQELYLVAVIQSTENKRIEKELHKKYAAQNIRGEWFALSDDDIKNIVADHKGKYLCHQDEKRN
jgi:hypothetical protein